MSEQVTFESYRQQWLEDVEQGNPSSVEKGHRFAYKFVQQFFELDETAEDNLFLCDGSGDGGIDIAYLQTGSSQSSGSSEDDAVASGDTWYLIQSKYGTAFKGKSTLIEEGSKIIDTILGDGSKASSLTADVVEKLHTFRSQAGDDDRIVLLFVTVDEIHAEHNSASSDIEILGQKKLGSLFETKTVSLSDLYKRETSPRPSNHLTLTLGGNLSTSSDNKMVAGTVSLYSLYQFLDNFKKQTGDLDALYERNVRRFLGDRGRVNANMRATLLNTPELFGLYNNGVTIVVEEYEKADGNFLLAAPQVVNGCQTTSTIFKTLQTKLNTGGTGPKTQEALQWESKLHDGVVIVKIVKVGADHDLLQQNITRYTNSQNAIREKDFMALEGQLKTWARAMDKEYGLFLEIQKGSWEAHKAAQKQNKKVKYYSDEQVANAFDLLKVYGAGWLGEPGAAWQQNKAFIPPTGHIYKRIVETDSNTPFGVADLYAAYLLQKEADALKFGRTAKKPSRKITRFLFYFVTLELLRRLMPKSEQGKTRSACTEALTKVLQSSSKSYLIEAAADVIDEYLDEDNTKSVYEELSYQGNINSFLKNASVGKPDFSPKLLELVDQQRSLLKKAKVQNASLHDLLIKEISDVPYSV